MHHPTLGRRRLSAILALGVSAPLAAQTAAPAPTDAPAATPPASPRSILDGYPDDATLAKRLLAIASSNADRV